MISDETAYRRYLDGEEKAADLLVERYGDALTLYIHGYLRDMHEAEDLMIDAFSQIFAKERPITGAGRVQGVPVQDSAASRPAPQQAKPAAPSSARRAPL